MTTQLDELFERNRRWAATTARVRGSRVGGAVIASGPMVAVTVAASRRPRRPGSTARAATDARHELQVER